VLMMSARDAGLGDARPPPDVFGREPDRRAIAELLDGRDSPGGALIIGGEAGVGKSALLLDAARAGSARGRLLLRCSGLQAESTMPYAGLHQLLRPILSEMDRLPSAQREAMSAAFGMDARGSGDRAREPVDLFLVGLATLELLAEVGESRRVLLIVEDAHWLDHSTQTVLVFLARRIANDPIVLLAAVRDDSLSPLAHGGLRKRVLEPLQEAAAYALVDTVAPDLAVEARELVLREAAGLPLALVELPRAFAEHGIPVEGASEVPLTDRLESAFTARLASLPHRTQALLTVAAIDDGDALDEVLTAGSLLEREEMTVDDLVPAASAGLADLDDWSVRFRHPLMRAAIARSVSEPRRRAVHRALEGVLTAYPDRRVWHRANAATGPDEQVAAELEAAANRAAATGAMRSAAAALERAASLTSDPALRGPRLLRAAELRVELESFDQAQRLVARTDGLPLSPVDQVRAKWLTHGNDLLGVAAQGNVGPLIEVVDQLREGGALEAAMRILLLISHLFWVAGTDDSGRQQVVSAVKRMPVDQARPQILAILALVDPVAQGPEILARFAEDDSVKVSGPYDALQAGGALLLSGSPAQSMPYLDAAVRDLRTQGRLEILAEALQNQAYAGIWTGQWDVAFAAADEAIRLANEIGALAAVAGSAGERSAGGARAVLAALRGSRQEVEVLTEAMDRFFLPVGAKAMVAWAQMARGFLALGEGDYAVAAEHLGRIFDPADAAYAQSIQQWAIAEMVEAAIGSGDRERAVRAVAQVEPREATMQSPLLRAGLVRARLALAGADASEAAFGVALENELADFPFMRARTLLMYGALLRRKRRPSESRAPLRAALETFDGLGASQWADRARQELRASGETSGSRAPDFRDKLTPQELQIAKMAAQGLTNREIGQRLFLSNRTVGSHLYRIFPKLNVSSRRQLRDVVDSSDVLFAP
jgi:DNA-binding CsgD family transcriptional regulator